MTVARMVIYLCFRRSARLLFFVADLFHPLHDFAEEVFLESDMGHDGDC